MLDAMREENTNEYRNAEISSSMTGVVGAMDTVGGIMRLEGLTDEAGRRDDPWGQLLPQFLGLSFAFRRDRSLQQWRWCGRELTADLELELEMVRRG